MTCTACSTDPLAQPLPTSGPLTKNVDLSLASLRQRIEKSSDGRAVYPYVVASVHYDRGRFGQTGCSPNFQGGVITLCTCKHLLRTYRRVRKSEGVWIVGVTGSGLVMRGRHLFYLMFARPFESHAGLWSHLGSRVSQAKSATRDRLGDMYEPQTVGLVGDERFRVSRYRPPIVGHVHRSSASDHEWERDIDRTYRRGTRPVLLCCDSRLSFIWTKPQIPLRENANVPLPRNPTKSTSIQHFLRRLAQEGT